MSNYNDWLLLFASNKMSFTDDSGNEYQIKKSYLPDGSMLMSDTKDKWSVELGNSRSNNIHSMIFNAEKNKLSAVDMIYNAINTRNTKLCDDGKALFASANEVLDKMKRMTNDIDKEKLNIELKIYQKKREIYLSPKDVKLTTDLAGLFDEQKTFDVASKAPIQTVTALKKTGKVPTLDLSFVKKTTKKDLLIVKKKKQR